MRFLIVDDNEANLYMLLSLLEGHGHQVLTAQNGEQALQIGRQNLPDIIVTDILMPVMDGFALCREWKQDDRLKSIPFVFYTATYTDRRDEQFALSLGAERFIIKPEEPDTLLKILQDVLTDSEISQAVNPQEPVEEEVIYLREYNEALVRKLQQKVEKLEAATRQLQGTITALEATERSLQQSEELLQEAQRIAMLGNWNWDVIENIVYWSDETYRILGLAPQGTQATYESFLDKIHPDDRENVRAVIDKALYDFTPYNIEHRIVHPDGSERIVYGYGEVALTEEGQALRLVGTIQDITERKMAEIALREKEMLQIELEKERELNKLKYRFVSMLSHEFKTPLTIINSYAGTLIRYDDRIGKAKKLDKLQTIQAQVTRLNSLVNDTLTICRTDMVGLNFEPDTLDLKSLCQELVATFQSTLPENVQIMFSSLGTCHDLTLDKSLVQQIVTNLLSNAIKYSPQGGTVYLKLIYEPQQTIIQIRDEGVGIPEQDQQRLFEAFHRASNVGNISGTGLGLVVVRQAVEAHGGTISFESQEGNGTQFSITFPLSTQN